TLDWPEPGDWLRRVAASPLVTPGEDVGSLDARPLRLFGSWLYLDRYWSEEVQVAASLRRLAAEPIAGVDPERLEQDVARLFATHPDGRQAQAALAAARRRFAVVAGGPGTGKTTTVARIVALIG